MITSMIAGMMAAHHLRAADRIWYKHDLEHTDSLSPEGKRAWQLYTYHTSRYGYWNRIERSP